MPSITPIMRPPAILIKVTTIPAMASPRTNFEAPSMAPKKSASSLTCSRRCWAWTSSIIPAFKSASIAICLPGIPSKANRAATSLMRVAPLVITTNWITTMMTKMIIPTRIWSPATNSPKRWITPPAALIPSSWAPVRINRVVATFKTKRAKVVASRSEGKILNSSGVLT